LFSSVLTRDELELRDKPIHKSTQHAMEKTAQLSARTHARTHALANSWLRHWRTPLLLLLLLHRGGSRTNI